MCGIVYLLSFLFVLLPVFELDSSDSGNSPKMSDTNERMVQKKKLLSTIVDGNIDQAIIEIKKLEKLIADADIYVFCMDEVIRQCFLYKNNGDDIELRFHQLGSEYLEKVLKKDVKVRTAGTQWGLLNYLVVEKIITEAKTDKKSIDTKKILTAVEHLCRLWNAVEKKIDRNFSLDDYKDALKPLWEISTHYHTWGMDPNDIANEVERKKCVEHLKKQTAILRKRNEINNALDFQNTNKDEFIKTLIKLTYLEPKIKKQIEEIAKKYDCPFPAKNIFR